MNSHSFRVVDVSAGTILTLFYSFLTAALLYSKDAPLPLLMLWAGGSAILCFFVLEGMNYFEAFRPIPSRANFLTLVLSLPWAPLVFNFLLGAAAGQGILRYRGIFWITPVAALLVLAYQYISGYFFVRSGRTRRVWLLIPPDDQAEFKQELARLGLARFFDWVTSDQNPDLIVFSRTEARDFNKNPDLLAAHLRGVPIVDIRILLAQLRGRIKLDTDLWLYLQAATKQTGVSRVYAYVKSVVEPTLALILGLIFFPLLLLIAIGVKLSSPGPVFFTQLRTGYQGRPFRLLKFRTMRAAPQEAPATWANSEVQRITKFGAFLRTSHLDELPQLWNVMMGELSFVGPRPERPEFYELLKEPVPLFYLRTMVRPGITGWAQLLGGYAGSVDESRTKLEYDLYYMQHMSPQLDFIVLVKTVLIFLRLSDPKAL
jgi:lipopolysaccharide/colanic/teichoic acid biosynthesis glycosyltransferase